MASWSQNDPAQMHAKLHVYRIVENKYDAAMTHQNGQCKHNKLFKSTAQSSLNFSLNFICDAELIAL